ncbi:MAG: hypothetical protein RIR26_1338, partial [Pseudomonadota bacterium]
LTSISNGTIKKGSTSMVAMTGVSQANPTTPTTNAQLVPGESIVFFPTSTTTGSAVTLATVRAWDGVTYSANEATLQATFVAASNQIPVLTYVKDFVGGVKNTAYVFSYSNLRGDPSLISSGTQRTDAFDAEENIASMTLKFRVKSMTAGSTLARTSPTAYNFTGSGTETIDPSQSFTWTPPTDYTGRQPAFTIVAYDGTNEGSNGNGTAIQVYVNINADPVFVNSTNIISGVSESSPYVITYDKLFSLFPSSDDTTGVLGYRISSLTGATGTLQYYASGVLTNVTAPYTMYPGDQVVWTPPMYENFNTVPVHQVFKMRLVDNQGALSTEIDVKATVAPINDRPVLMSASSLSSVAKNATKTITYADIFNAIDFRDYDVNSSAKPGINDPHGISFRIESVNAGTLQGSTGTVISPVASTLSTMKYLVQSSPDLSSSWSSLTWTPPSNLTGTFTVMKVRIFDGQDFSDSVASINITVTAANSAPTASASSFNYMPGIDENGGLLVKYDDVMGYSGASDADGDLIRFKVVRLTSGTITWNGTTYTTAGLLSTPFTVGPGQTFIWRPSANANGTISAFGITLTDGMADSTEIAVTVTVSSINSAPTVAYTQPVLEGAPYYTFGANPFAISYDTLVTNLGVTDVETGTTGLTFAVSEWLGGQAIGSSTSSNCSSNVTPYTAPLSVSTNSSSTYLCWTPPAGTSGVVTAFRLQVSDPSGAISGQSALVSINIDPGNNVAPSFLSGCRAATSATNVTCSTSNVFGSPSSSVWDIRRSNGATVTWTYDQLKALSGVTDPDSSVLYFVVTSISSTLVTGSASFQKAGTNMSAYTTGTPATTSLIGVGESVVYSTRSTIGTAGSTYQLFTFKAYDGLALSATSLPISVKMQSATGLAPTFTHSAPIALTSITAGDWNEIPYADVRDTLDAYDIDDLSYANLSFLISGSPGSNITVTKKGSGACGTGTDTSIVAGTTQFGPGASLCVQLNSTSSATLATKTNMLPAVNLRTIDWTGSANGAATGTGNYIPLMVRSP